ncbi:MFS transporter [Pseudomonas sp. 3A(2025)]
MKLGQRLGYQQALIGWFNFVLAVPAIYIWLGLPLILRQHGWSGTDIGLLQLAGLPAVIKFLLAWPVDRVRLPSSLQGRRYSVWTLGLSLVLLVVFVLLGRDSLLNERRQLFTLALLASLVTTWTDVPLNALAIRLLPAAQRGRAGSIRSASLSLAAIVGGGLMVVIETRWGWSVPFWVMGVLLVSAMLLLWPLRETHQAAEPPTPVSASPARYFAQPQAGRWTVLLLILFPCLGAAWVYLKPLLLDHGFAVEQAAMIAGVGGGLLAALASAASVRLMVRLGIARSLLGCTVSGLLALSLLTAAVLTHASSGWLISTVALVSIAMGMTASLTFSLMMHFSRQHSPASDYGLQASLFTLTRLLVPLAAGVLLDRLGYGGMLLTLSVAMLLVVGLASMWRLRLAAAVDKR